MGAHLHLGWLPDCKYSKKPRDSALIRWRKCWMPLFCCCNIVLYLCSIHHYFHFCIHFLWLRHVLTQSIIIFATKIDNDMSKQVEQMRRMLLILNNIKKRQRISKQELLSRVNDSLYYIYGYKEIGVRTLERDLEDIESMFCVSITYDRSNN